MASNNNVNCAQVKDVEGAVRQFQTQGCTVKWQARSGCMMMDCKDHSVYVCRTPNSDPGVSVSPHDESDEPYIDYWRETPD